MKSGTASGRMDAWASTPARAQTVRLEDSGTRRAAAQRALTHLRVDAQRLVDRAAAGGADLAELLAMPSFRQTVRAGQTASRELRVASALLRL
jgi:hypothetical protein